MRKVSETSIEGRQRRWPGALTDYNPSPDHNNRTSSILRKTIVRMRLTERVDNRLTSPYKNSEGIPVITEIMENETYVSATTSEFQAALALKRMNDVVVDLRQSSKEAKKPRKL